MDWRKGAARLLTLLFSLIASTATIEEGFPHPTSTIFKQPTTPSTTAANLIQTTTTISIGPTSYTSSTPAPTEAPPRPRPTPSPDAEFIRFRDDFVYLIVEDITVRYNNVAFYTGNFSVMEFSDNVEPENNRITLRRSYSLNGDPHFVVTFVFSKDDDDGLWYMQNFMHQNLTENDTVFQYKGIQYSIFAPLHMAYLCTALELHGFAGGDANITSTLRFDHITAQAFNHGQLSSETVICGDTPDRPNFNVGVVIGVLAGVCSIALIVVVVIAGVLLIKKTRRRGYDLLDTK